MSKVAKYLIDVKKKDYYTQRNNRISPLVSCNVTSMIQAADILGFSNKFPNDPKYTQPEDALRYLIENARENPTEHAVLSKFTNQFLGGNYTQFSTTTLTRDILQEIRESRPVVLSGNFPYINSKGQKVTLGHINTLIGYEIDKRGDLAKVTILDPFGNPLNNFKGSGYHIELTAYQFYKFYKPVDFKDHKWAHTWKL